MSYQRICGNHGSGVRRLIFLFLIITLNESNFTDDDSPSPAHHTSYHKVTIIGNKDLVARAHDAPISVVGTYRVNGNVHILALWGYRERSFEERYQHFVPLLGSEGCLTCT